MLHFILGHVSSGKTTYLHKKLGELIEHGEKNITLLVPEQFTFETDKGILNTIGVVNSNKIDVFSFTRLADSIFEFYNVKNKEALSEQGRILYMSMALESLQDKLEIYGKQIKNPALVQSMLLVIDEFKQAASDINEIKLIVENIESEFLKKKMNELILIYEAFDAIVNVNYSDSRDSIGQLSELLKEKKYFENKIVAIDGFTSFNGQILKVIEQIILQAKDVYIAVTADGLNYNSLENDIFASTRRTVNKIRTIAEKNYIPVGKPITINSLTTGYKKYSDEAMEFLEENIYKPNYEVYDGNCDCINIYGADTPEDECGFVSRKIRQLMREGYRCRDIAVIYRDSETYENELKYAFRKYDIPAFDDARQPIVNQPIMIYISNLLRICSEGVTTENMLSLLKTGLTGINADDINMFENYIFMWNIDGSKWKNEWKYSPYGFGKSKNDDENQLLKKINAIRKQLVDPIEQIKNETKEKNAKEISAVIYNHLIRENIDKNLKQLAITLEDDGEAALAYEQQQMWDLLMEILNEIAVALENCYPSMKKYADFFKLSVAVKSLGRIPTGIDEVIIGSADKIRARNIKVAFVLGLNAGVFPKINSGLGVITDRDRTKLLSYGIELYDINKYKTVEERFNVYNSVCCAKEKVFLSYCLKNKVNEKMLPSEVITMVKRILPKCKEVFKPQLDTREFIEGGAGAFEVFASKVKEKDFYFYNLSAYFKNNEKYKSKLKTLEDLSLSKRKEIVSKEISEELFGKNMYLSASRIETYENCPFQYFCRYALKAEPRKVAALDPSQSGTVIHSVLEDLVKKYSSNSMKRVAPEECKRDIMTMLKLYAEKEMGGFEDKDERFIYQFNRLAKSIYVILERIFAEFKNSLFLPCDFELSIGKDPSSVKPYKIQLKDGNSVEIFGFVDRVDKMETENYTYIRVIDYKTGAKEMRLSDVLNGLNMQMLIYLITIWKNGSDRYGNNIVPAGVLYLPARFSKFKAERDADEEEIQNLIMKNGKMNGLLLDDTRSVLGMDEKGTGLFIPAGINSKSGKVTGNIISLPQLKMLNKKIDGIISEMADNLLSGKIWAYPVNGKEHDKTCEYCNYKSVCGFEADKGEYRYISFLKHDECLETLNGGENDEQ